MIWARDYHCGRRLEATPGARGQCPTCRSDLIPKCGSIYQAHWSHRSGSDCDSWAEVETEWHCRWKRAFPDEWQEVDILGMHRADILTDCGVVFEFQHSFISVPELLEREDFYGPNMKWVVDGEPFLERIYLYPKGDYWSFYWKHARLTWGFARRDLFIDMRDGYLFQIRKSSGSKGYGTFISSEDMLRRHGGNVSMEFDSVLDDHCPGCGRNRCYEWFREDGTEYRRCHLCGVISYR